MKVCIDCGIEKELKFFKQSFGGGAYKNRCHACYSRRYRSKLKYDFFSAYGKACTCCGESDFRFLTFEHLNADGNIHRETLNEQQIMAEARRENYPKDKYTVLCFNCNCGKSCNNGICPHKCQTKEQAWEELEKDVEQTGRKFVKFNNQYTINKTPEQKFLDAAKGLGLTKEQLQELADKLQ